RWPALVPRAPAAGLAVLAKAPAPAPARRSAPPPPRPVPGRREAPPTWRPRPIASARRASACAASFDRFGRHQLPVGVARGCLARERPDVGDVADVHGIAVDHLAVLVVRGGDQLGVEAGRDRVVGSIYSARGVFWAD